MGFVKNIFKSLVYFKLNIEFKSLTLTCLCKHSSLLLVFHLSLTQINVISGDFSIQCILFQRVIL